MNKKNLSISIFLTVLFATILISVPGSEAQDQASELTNALSANPNLDAYIVIMSLDPVVSYSGGVAGLKATRPEQKQTIDKRSALVTNYVTYLKNEHDSALTSAGSEPKMKLYDYTYAINGFAALLTDDQVLKMSKQPGVAAVHRDEMRYKTTDTSPRFLGLTKPKGPWASGITGEGVVVGVIDTGIWPEHPSFADDGSYSDPPGILEDTEENPACNFGNSLHNPDDNQFTCNNKLIGAREFLRTYKAFIGLDPDEFDSARDDDGHGTHTASTAAGNLNVPAHIFGIPRGDISGIAPRAHIIAYKGLGRLGGFSSDLAAAIDQAVADGVDVINYSIGSTSAGLTGMDDIAFLFAADAGVFVATSAGNAGPAPGTIGAPASVPWVTSVGANTHDRTFISKIKLKGPGRPPRGLWGGSVTPGIKNFNLVDAQGVPDVVGDTSGMCLNAFDPGTFDAHDAILCNRFNFGVARPQRVANVATGGGGAVIFHNSESVNMTPTDNHPLPTVHILYKVGIPLKEYLVKYPGRVTVSFKSSTARYARYDRRVMPNVMASFSSRGPNPAALDIIKPDVTAPGISILGAASPDHVEAAAQGQLFQAIMGTSMSGPQVAGALALLKQAHPEWTPAMAKSALMTTARRNVKKEDGRSLADPFDVGAGHINPGSTSKFSPFNPGLVYDAGFFDYLGFLCTAAPEIFTDPAGTCAFLESIGIPTDPSDLNLPSIGVAKLAGSQTVRRTVTNVTEEKLTLVGWARKPAGYKVTVNPWYLNLEAGESATYEVNITNRYAPVGEWKFGSITWLGFKHRQKFLAHSPIAVRAARFLAPSEIFGSGETGATSFEISFGYSGAYSAAPHGLEPATVTEDNVLQDPDQSFNPTDGYSNLHQFVLSGAAHFRIAMPPEATEAGADLDIYVFDPAGNFAAASTKGGTDELIDIPQPVDGTWSVFVHGWYTPTGDSDYDMFSWEVSATPGGSLVIDSAPASATIGDKEAIQIS